MSRSLTTEERKKLLLLACTWDRLELALAMRKRSSIAKAVERLSYPPWLDMAISTAMPYLPRKLRFLNFLWRIWRLRGRMG